MTRRYSLIGMDSEIIKEIRSIFPDVIIDEQEFWSMDINGHEGFVGFFPTSAIFRTDEDSLWAQMRWNLKIML